MDSYEDWDTVITAFRTADAVRPPVSASAPAPASGTVIVFSRSELICDGVIGLLPKEWRDRIVLASEVAVLERRLDGHRAAVIVDADTEGASEAIKMTVENGGTAILLLGPGGQAIDRSALDAANAIVNRDEAEPLTLRTALAAGRLGMRLVPSSFEPRGDAGRHSGAALSETAIRALTLLADGWRDAEISRELNLSESAVRKLVQRAVRALGARTRCQAVAIAARDGALTEWP